MAIAGTLSGACRATQRAEYGYHGVTYDATCIVVPPDRLGQPVSLDEGQNVKQARMIQGIATNAAIAIKFVGSPCEGESASAFYLSTSRELSEEQEEGIADDVRSR